MLIDGDDQEEIITPPPPELPLALKSPIRFGVRMVGIVFLLKISVGLLVLLPIHLLLPLKEVFADGGVTEKVWNEGRRIIFLSFLVLPIETFLGQGGPIWALSKLHVKSHRVLCVLSATCFGFLHLGTGVLDVFNAFVGGLILSHCWLSWRPGSLKLAFWGTTFVHAAHNGIIFALFGLLSSLGPDLPSKPLPGMESPPFMDRAEGMDAMKIKAGVLQRPVVLLMSESKIDDVFQGERRRRRCGSSSLSFRTMRWNKGTLDTYIPKLISYKMTRI